MVSTYRVLRYEDMATNIYDTTKRIFKFFRLQYSAQVRNFLRSHTTVDVGGLYSTRRHSKTTPFHWTQDFKDNFQEVSNIQFHCKTAMKLWGYRMATNSSHMLSFHPFGKPPWKSMKWPLRMNNRAQATNMTSVLASTRKQNEIHLSHFDFVDWTNKFIFLIMISNNLTFIAALRSVSILADCPNPFKFVKAVTF